MVVNLIVWYLAGYGFGRMWYDITVKKLRLDGKQVLVGVHFHHTLFAVILFIVGIFKYSHAESMVGVYAIFAGIGLLTEYFIEWGKLHFVTLQQPKGKRKDSLK